VKPGDAVPRRVDGGYSHEFTTAQVHYFLKRSTGRTTASEPAKFAVFEDHLLYATASPRMKPFEARSRPAPPAARVPAAHGRARLLGGRRRSPGICHQVAREQFVDPGDFIQATDSHTCMGGGNNALTYGVGATEYAGLVYSGFTFVKVPESIRFELVGKLARRARPRT
jgi:3-isopropylmalate/(R)-2-methylmalate dehydratase large subunit